MPMLGNGVYTVTEAARLTQLRPARVREWFRGRRQHDRPVFDSDYDPIEGDLAISFFDLIDVYVAGHLREYGVTLRTIKRAHRKLANELKVKHPFCHRELLTDGEVIFVRAFGQDGDLELKEAATGQKVFCSFLIPFLKKIDYDHVSLLAKKWHISRQVVINPAICFGRPIIEEVGKPTAILAAAYHANNRNIDLVSSLYRVERKHVIAAVRFEKSLAA